MKERERAKQRRGREIGEKERKERRERESEKDIFGELNLVFTSIRNLS